MQPVEECNPWMSGVSASNFCHVSLTELGVKSLSNFHLPKTYRFQNKSPRVQQKRILHAMQSCAINCSSTIPHSGKIVNNTGLREPEVRFRVTCYAPSWIPTIKASCCCRHGRCAGVQNAQSTKCTKDF